MNQDNRPQLTTKNRLAFLFGFVFFLGGWYSLGISDSRMMTWSSLLVMVIGGIIVSNIADSHAKREDYFKKILDDPINKMQKNDVDNRTEENNV